mmetsp:Transcript_7791/g.18651  ORF Transcript_7791/g.18651 Transcript_7791/m.18651 type:complete len:135 (-) Transcript_7791:291-695(-)
MVGMPYPNPRDPELRERMAQLDAAAAQAGGGGTAVDGRSYYEDLCMKAVNQCIGRVIRHTEDYAAVILLDQRYAAAASGGTLGGPLRKLPEWMKPSVAIGVSNRGFGCVLREVKRFFHKWSGSVAQVSSQPDHL